MNFAIKTDHNDLLYACFLPQEKKLTSTNRMLSDPDQTDQLYIN